MSGLAGLAVVEKLSAVPARVWVIAAAALALLGLVMWHKHEVKVAYDNGVTAGAERAYKRVENKARKLEQSAKALTDKIRSRNDQASGRIVAHADALRLRGPGRAACPVAAGTGAGGYQPGSGAGDAPVGRVSYPERIELIALPFPGTVAFAQQCDLNRAEAQAWRDQHEALVKDWERENKR